MNEAFITFVKKMELFNPEDKVLLAVSGGIDSVVMLKLFRDSGFRFAIAHCNFSLRGKDSDEDSKFVEDLAAEYEVPFYQCKFNTKAYANRNKISVQMAARELRYQWFDRLLVESVYNYVATAHHLDDQVETCLLNLIRVTGIAGLHGIPVKQGKVIRPLLFAYKNEIESYVKNNKLAFREDDSNNKDDYQRNYIRHHIIPGFERICPEFKFNINKSVLNFRMAEDVLSNHLNVVKDSIVSKEGRYVIIDIENLKNLYSPEFYLFEYIKSYGFNFSQVMEIIPAMNSISGKQFFSGTHLLTIDRKRLIICKKPIDTTKKHLIRKSVNGVKEPVGLIISTLKRTEKFSPGKDRNIALLDYDLLKFPLCLRKWSRGDIFYPLGMNSRKKISDFFIDNKFPLPEKQNTWLLCSGEDVVWVVGHRIDERYKVTDSTRRICKIVLS